MRRVEDEAARLLKGKPEPAAEPARRTQEEATGSLQREGDFWTLIAGGRMVRLKDVKGLHHLALLLANPGVEFHALEIIGRDEGHGGEETVNGRGRDRGADTPPVRPASAPCSTPRPRPPTAPASTTSRRRSTRPRR